MPAPPVVISVNVSSGGIPKRPLDVAKVTIDGIEDDAHDHDKHNTPLQALSILDVEDLQDLREEGFAVGPGITGENVTVRGLDVDRLEVGQRLRFSGGLEIELTKRRKPCYVLDSISPALKEVIAGRCGFYAKVLAPGRLMPGETIEVVDEAASR